MDEMFGLGVVRSDIYTQADIADMFGKTPGRIAQLIPRLNDGDPARILRPDLRTVSGTPLFSESRIRLLIETQPLLKKWVAEREAGVRPS